SPITLRALDPSLSPPLPTRLSSDLAQPPCSTTARSPPGRLGAIRAGRASPPMQLGRAHPPGGDRWRRAPGRVGPERSKQHRAAEDRKSTRLNSSHVKISYAVFCLKK